ncbi:NADH-dependent [FeFe] hydrogenase, group A6 [Blautia glucerasea]|uniref:NADH-dependent [FeFe] hydrogenase, group A6 n=1 Tax=Blautia glucerasea TaxID=536633 RepID=UPI001D074216|nr:NADH-dependent [FeFe] hydrogenase, group A6 [Blautia glucerasea]MCB6544865.1 [FeFe] hydrogenase, group A [Blautia glucerasea]
MIHLTIDGEAVSVPEGTTILEAAKHLNVHIPTLCHHEDQAVKAVCRICVVEVEGQKLLPAACSTPVTEGMDVKTASPKVIKARKNIMELILARHPQDCLVCSKNGSCELQKVAKDLNMNKPNRYEMQVRDSRFDDSSPSIVRDMSKCILCNRCVEVCSEKQGVMVMAKENRGFDTVIVPPYGKLLVDTSCVNCGQCVQVCPVGALSVHDDTEKIYDEINMGKYMTVQIAPSVRITLAESLGYKPGTVTTGKIVHALRKIGFHKVFDSDFSADLTIMEEGTEFLKRMESGENLPLITSCCPAWVKYCETYGYEQLNHLSTAKSPQQMFGAVIKTFFAEKEKIDPADICSVSVMPCTAKKFECKRKEFHDSGFQDVDISITVEELARMIRTAGIHFDDLEDQEFDAPFGLGSGAGQIFGSTGGVMEAALRTVYEILTGKTLEKLEFTQVRGLEGIREAALEINGKEIRVAIVHGLKNVEGILEQIKAGRSPYHFIEVMACEGGCIGGGGNTPKTMAKVRKRQRAIYEEDRKLPIRKSHENIYVKKLYEEYLGEPLGEKSHHLLHTTYHSRRDLLR